VTNGRYAVTNGDLEKWMIQIPDTQLKKADFRTPGMQLNPRLEMPAAGGIPASNAPKREGPRSPGARGGDTRKDQNFTTALNW
jgi:hypothetical protein